MNPSPAIESTRSFGWGTCSVSLTTFVDAGYELVICSNIPRKERYRARVKHLAELVHHHETSDMSFYIGQNVHYFLARLRYDEAAIRATLDPNRYYLARRGKSSGYCLDVAPSFSNREEANAAEKTLRSPYERFLVVPGTETSHYRLPPLNPNANHRPVAL